MRQQQDGAKGVKVGTRIAVIAETEDDLSSLELPAEEAASVSSPQEETASSIDPSRSSPTQAEGPPASRGEPTPPVGSSEAPSSSPSGRPPPGKAQKQKYPLYPSIVRLLHEKDIPISEADKIPASGPKGRLLKGDVLAYLGKISSSYPSEQSARITKLGHLDLSNAKPAPPKEAPPPPTSKAQPLAATEPEITETEIAVPISLSSVLSVQKRIQATLGVTLPLSTFIARATELANDSLPRAAGPPTADELFNDVLGLNNISSKVSKGHFVPQITALPNTALSKKLGPQREPDVYDILTRTASSSIAAKKGIPVPPMGIMAGSSQGDATNVFSVSAARGEQKRARVFLERVKTILQVEPGRLIL